MQTKDFEKNLERLIEMGRKEVVAFMCAEAVPWRCHRSLISDALTIRHIAVHDIQSRVSAPLHILTPFASVKGRQITYPPEQTEFQGIRRTGRDNADLRRLPEVLRRVAGFPFNVAAGGRALVGVHGFIRKHCIHR